jgi:hypothetical protein
MKAFTFSLFSKTHLSKEILSEKRKNINKMSPRNSSLNQTTAVDGEHYPTVDQILTMIGSTLPIDCLWLYVSAPLNAIGVLLNLLTLAILQDKQFDTRLHDYLRVNSACSCALNFLIMFTFVFNSRRILAWANTGAAWKFAVWIMLPATNLLYLFGTVMDCLILLDRIGTFRNRVTRWIKLSAYKTSLIAFFCCAAFDFPYFFAYTPASLTVNLNATHAETFWYFSQSAYSLSQVGIVINFIMFTVKNLVFTSIVLILNVISVYLLKEYMVNKSRLFGKPSSAKVAAAPNAAINRPGGYGIQNRVKIAPAAKRYKETRNERSLKVNQNMSIMVIIISFMSILEHLILFASGIYPYFGSDAVILQLISYLACLSISSKHALNFVLFYFFSIKFQLICAKLFKKLKFK